MAIDPGKDAERQAPTRNQHSSHFGQGGLTVGEKHQRELAQHQIEVVIWVR
jgi:hypothetical protein